MPLVTVHKAGRSRRLKGRPEWQDILPPDKALRDAYAIAARHVDRFARAFLDVSRGLFTAEVLDAVGSKLRDGSAEEALGAVPWFASGSGTSDALWKRLQDRLAVAYGDVVTESGKAEYRRLKLPLAFEVQKARVPTVPINPYSLRWIRQQAGKVIAEISDTQRETVREVILDGFARGQRAEAILAEVQQSVGLLARERAAVARRRALHEEAGLPPDNVDALTTKYADELLVKRAQRIARTETIAAQAQGRNDSWRVALESGALPRTVVRVWVAPPASPNPGRPCPICLDLDGKTAGIDESYESTFLGAVARPPSHPQCRCSEVLRRGGD